jgi:hypothetical protein
MDITLSIPEPTFKAAQQLAGKLGVSLSKLYTDAITTYLSSNQEDEITSLLNQVYATDSSALDPALVQMQMASFGEERW